MVSPKKSWLQNVQSAREFLAGAVLLMVFMGTPVALLGFFVPSVVTIPVALFGALFVVTYILRWAGDETGTALKTGVVVGSVSVVALNFWFGKFAPPALGMILLLAWGGCQHFLKVPFPKDA